MVSLKDISEKLGGILIKNTIQGRFKYHSYKCEYIEKTKNNPAYLDIILNCTFPLKMKICRENKFDKLSKNIGLSKEVQTGDPEFDVNFYIDCDSFDFATSFFYDKEKIEITKKIFAQESNILKIVFSENFILIKISPCNIEYTSHTLIQNILSLSEQYLKNLSYISSTDLILMNKNWKLLQTILFLFILSGFGFTLAGYIKYKPMETDIYVASLQYSVPACLLFLWIITQRLKGKSNAHKIFISIMILSLSGFLLSSTGFFVFTNGYFDKSILQTKEVIVFDKYFTRNRNSKTYYIKYLSLKNKNTLRRLSVNRSFYETIKANDIVNIKTRSGKWNFEWLAGYEKK